MLILTQRRNEIVNTDFFDTLTVRHAVPYPLEAENAEVIAVKTNFETSDEEIFTLGVYVNTISAEGVLANIAVAARDGKGAYIMEK